MGVVGVVLVLLVAATTAAAPTPAAGQSQRILLVAGTNRPPANDRVMLDRLRATGLTVDIVDDDSLPVDLDGVALVAISSSVRPATVGTKLSDAPVPILSYEPLLHDELGLSEGRNAETPAATNIRLVEPGHPLAADLSGVVKVVLKASAMSFGTPPPSAQVVAVAANNPAQAVIYSVTTGESLAGGVTAPSCRTAMFPSYAGQQWLTDVGTALVDAAIAVTLACAQPVDNDGDGWSPPLDCDDDDPLINPGAEDVPLDGIDQDCNGRDRGGLTNVVVIMTDDMSYADYAFMPRTRALFEAEGVTFNRAVTNNPLCCPSRATLLTGQRSLTHGVRTNRPADGGGYPRLDHTNTFANWALADGYNTIHVGKFLNGYGTANYVSGVDNLVEVPPGWSDWQTFTSTIKPFQYKLNDNGRIVQYGTQPEHYYTDVVAQRAVESIEESVDANRPFFLWASIHAPHGVPPGPAVPAPRHAKAFDGVALPTPPSFNEDDVSDKPAYIRNAAPLDRARIDDLGVRYENRLESLQAADELVETIHRTLDDAGVLDETLLIFTSDNGFLMGEHRLVGKQVPYEESIRVPLAIRGGPFTGGVALDSLVSNLDLAPTITAALGITPQRQMDGLDLAPVMSDPTVLDHRALIIESFDAPVPYKAVRTEHWVWIEYDSGERELYDLVADPYQLASRHADPAYTEVRAQLENALAGLRTCRGAAACDGRLDLAPGPPAAPGEG
jgi:arylsulfatase A-like enzyme